MAVKNIKELHKGKYTCIITIYILKFDATFIIHFLLIDVLLILGRILLI